MLLYADILFFIDLSMDVLALWAAGRLTRSRMRARRILSAAAASSAVSVAATALGLSSASSVVLSLSLPLLMCLIAFGKSSARLLIKRYVCTWLGGLLLGGVMCALLRRGAARAYSAALDVTASALGVLPLGVLAVVLFIKTLSRSPPTRSVNVTLTLRHRSVTLRALCDSGNLLTDPFTGECVIIADPTAARALFTEEEFLALTSPASDAVAAHAELDVLAGRFRLIPASSISGELLLRAVRLDEVRIKDKSCRALVTLSSTVAGGDTAAVIPTQLL